MLQGLKTPDHSRAALINQHSRIVCGSFLARDWGSGPTVQLHKTSFALHEELAKDLNIESYRRIPVLSVTPGKCVTPTAPHRPRSRSKMTCGARWRAEVPHVWFFVFLSCVRRRRQNTNDICPWLDGELANSQWMDKDGGAQVAPYELCTKLMAAAQEAGAELRIGSVEGVEKAGEGGEGEGAVTHVKVDGEMVPCKAFVCTMGPWAACAQDWLDIPIPMTGIKSTSIVFKDEKKEVCMDYPSPHVAPQWCHHCALCACALVVCANMCVCVC